MKRTLLSIVMMLPGLIAVLSLSASMKAFAGEIIEDRLWKYIPSGSFVMGSHPDEEGRNTRYWEDQVKVDLTRSFEMMSTEVTQLQWFKLMGYNPSKFYKRKYCPNDFIVIKGTLLCPNNPVERVSWYTVKSFIKKLNKLSGNVGCELNPRSVKGCYRLPTEAEWEYAARAGSIDAYFFGDSPRHLKKYAWFEANSNRSTKRVAQKLPNSYGLYDMYGNVFEWVEDNTCLQLPGGKDPLCSRSSLTGIMRGGSWMSSSVYELRSADRGLLSHRKKGSIAGFRLVRNL